MTTINRPAQKNDTRYARKGMQKGDFAQGERTLPASPGAADFARGERDLPASTIEGDFATGEHELPPKTGDPAQEQTVAPMPVPPVGKN